jgi:hypothetical protein
MTENYEDLTDILDRLAWWRDETSAHIHDGEDTFVDNFPLDNISHAGWEIFRLRQENEDQQRELQRLRRTINDAIDIETDRYEGSPLSPVYGAIQTNLPEQVVENIAENFRNRLEHAGWRFTNVTSSQSFNGTWAVQWRGKPPATWDGASMP